MGLAAACETSSVTKYHPASAKGFTGIRRNQKDSVFGELYESTPILYPLPLVGSYCRIEERTIDNSNRYYYHPVGDGENIYQICHYSGGIEQPLKSNNFILTKYKTKYGDTMSRSFRAIDITLGILRVQVIPDDEAIEILNRKKNHTAKKRNLVPNPC